MKQKEEINSDNEKMKASGSKSKSMQDEDHEGLPDADIEVSDQVSKLEAELTAANDKYLRLYSDFENYKKRVSKDRIEQSKMAASEIFLALLPTLDDFERAMKSMDESGDNKSVMEGISLIYNKIRNITVAKGLKEMESINKPFDPELHDAIANIPAPKEKDKGNVIEEIEKGYYLNDKVLRHAKVIVAN